jgi:biotin operon repressor
MTRLAKITAATAAATTLAAGAYALGSQSGDGDALAAKSGGSTPSEHREAHLSGLADTLGVSEAKLRTALDELRKERTSGTSGEPGPRPGDKRDDLAAELATALGISEAKVRAGLEKLRPQAGERHEGDDRAAREKSEHPGRGRGDDLAASLAKVLGVDRAKVKAALDTLAKTRDEAFAKQRKEFAAALAAKLSLEPSAVENALGERGGLGGPFGGRHDGPGHDGPGHGGPGRGGPDGPGHHR